MSGREAWDVAVVGAGPAGSVAAAQLARLGASVLLVEAATFPRAKVCGCCLNGRALAALEAAGLAHVSGRLGAAPLSRFRLAAGGRQAEVPLPAGVAASREVFDAALAAEAVNRGADFLTGTRAALVDEDDPEWRCLRLTGGGVREVRARVVLAADGLGGGLLARAGLAHADVRAGSRIGAGAAFVSPMNAYERGVIHMASGRGGYVGLVRLEDDRLDVAAALDPVAVREAGGLAEVVAAVLWDAGWPVPQGLREAAWRGTPALTRQLRQVAGHRLFVLGDAAGYVEPFTGEGMAWAMASAVALAPIAFAASRQWRPGFAVSWARRYRLLGRGRFVCRALSELLRRPWLTQAVAYWLGVVPALASPVVSILNRNPIALFGDVR